MGGRDKPGHDGIYGFSVHKRIAHDDDGSPSGLIESPHHLRAIQVV
jgi:hypothetical protein